MLALSSARRAELFDSQLALWQDAAAKSDYNARPHLQYALLLKRTGRDREAWQEVSIAGAIDPFSPRIDDLRKAWGPKKETP
jgi:hypothetical protein